MHPSTELMCANCLFSEADATIPGKCSPELKYNCSAAHFVLLSDASCPCAVSLTPASCHGAGHQLQQASICSSLTGLTSSERGLSPASNLGSAEKCLPPHPARYINVIIPVNCKCYLIWEKSLCRCD